MRSSKHSHARGHRAKGKQQDNTKEFEKYYSGVYGSRWPSLRGALLKPTLHSAVANAFISGPATAACSAAGLMPILGLGPAQAFCLPNKASGPYPPPPLDPVSALRTWYWLDLASLLPALLLQPRRGHAVLDMCAAPGGKSVLIAQRIFQAAPSAQGQPLPSPLPLPQQQEQQQPASVTTVSTEAVSAAKANVAAPEGADEEAASSASVEGDGEGVKVGPPSEETPGCPAERKGVTAVEPAAAQPAASRPGGSPVDRPQPPSVTASLAENAAPESSSPDPLPQHVVVASPQPVGPSRLVCNEPDRSRLQRLQRVLEEYVPVSARAGVEVLNYQGHMYWARNQAVSYDRVLVDAPCSSDRHVLQHAAAAQRGAIAAADWSLGACRRIADEQLQLCLAAMRALRVGGRLVYSTCSIAPIQNDEVVDRLLRRCGPAAARVVAALEVLQQEASHLGMEMGASGNSQTEAGEVMAGRGHEGSGAGGPSVAEMLGLEATKLGAICLPDRRGWGPIFVAVVEKVGEVAGMGVTGLRPVATPGEEDDEEEEEGEQEQGEEYGEAEKENATD